MKDQDIRYMFQRPQDLITIEVEGQTVGLPTVTSSRVLTLVKRGGEWGYYDDRAPTMREMQEFVFAGGEKSSRWLP